MPLKSSGDKEIEKAAAEAEMPLLRLKHRGLGVIFAHRGEIKSGTRSSVVLTGSSRGWIQSFPDDATTRSGYKLRRAPWTVSGRV